MRSSNVWLGYFACILLTACGTQPIKPSDKHLQREQGGETNQAASIPQPVKRTIPLPSPTATPKPETYSVVVTNVPVQEILFALARDTKINIDIKGGSDPVMEQKITLNAIDQTLPQILDRISKLVDMRYELDNGNLVVMPDKAFLRIYKIDFINMKRDVKSKISTSTQIAGGGASGGGAGASGGASLSGDNSASTSVTSDTQNDLMLHLIEDVKNMLLDEDILHQKEQVTLQTQQNILARGTGAASGSTYLASPTKNTGIEINQAAKGGQVSSGSRTGSSVSGSGNQDVQGQGEVVAKKSEIERAVNVFANKETGVLIVRATSRQHEKVQEFIDKVMNTAKRQVLIEATIVEVRLSDNYKQGINWSALRAGAKGFNLTQAGTVGLPSANPLNIFTIDYANPTSNIGNLSAQISLLESFGKVKVLSSPKISVMNNQTATLKVADNKVYFTVTSNTTPCAPAPCTPITTYTTTPNTVSVGFFMNVTPQISDTDTVTINVRPTVSRILGYVIDPNPSLVAVQNKIPEIQSREMESIIKIDSGQIAVMGGLMQDEINNLTDAVPGLSNIPLLGNMFKNRNDTTTKTELVIFLRPVVIKDASVNADFSAFRSNLPDQNFFKESASGSKP